MITSNFPNMWKCPTCDAVYTNLQRAIPPDAQSANIYCHKCNSHYDLKPNKLLGWMLPTVIRRLMSE